MKRIGLILCCLLTLQVFAKSKITYLKMDRTPCYGRCPSFTIEFLKTGEVIYTGRSNTDMIGTYRAKMSKSAMNQFYKQFEKYNFIRLANEYKVLATDLPGLNFGLVVNGKRKNIKHAEAGPRYLKQMGADIDDKITQLKWEGEPGNEVKQEVRDEDINKEPSVYQFVEQMPEFPQGEMALKNYLTEHIQYPSIAKENNIEGKVFCKFVVDQSGYIRNAEVVKGIGYGCDDEAIRVINAMPKWKPGMQNGKAVSVYYTLPVFFKLR
jgi:TonB family protein